MATAARDADAPLVAALRELADQRHRDPRWWRRGSRRSSSGCHRTIRSGLIWLYISILKLLALLSRNS